MRSKRSGEPQLFLVLALLAMIAFLPIDAQALTINVVDASGTPITGGYRWLVEEDATYHVQPGVIDPKTLAVKFHSSFMPAVAQGNQMNSGNIALDPSKRYFVSVLPNSASSPTGYTIGGAPVKPGQAAVTVTVNKLPLPTAQISVLVFQDDNPINNAPNIPGEAGLPGFQVFLYEAGGRYGIAGGQVSQDAFGNPLGTTYDANGNVVTLGNNVIKTGADGRALIKYLPQGKYTIQVIPPAGQNWIQTSTLEGTKGIDAWVKPGEPAYFAEFGPPGVHVFVGFVKPTNDTTVLTGGATLTGRVTNLHLSHPPNTIFNSGGPIGHTTPWVGLNALVAAGPGRGLYAQRANPDATFSIPNVPPGSYQLVVWDDNLDIIFATHNVTIVAGQATLALGDVPAFQWFSRIESTVFNDRNQNGFRDCVTPACSDPNVDDVGIPNVPVNLRFRDGSIYQSFPTDTTGFVPFDEVFPFFSWLVAEVDYARLKATGVTVIVDNGGPVNPDQGWLYPSRDILAPQPQVDASGQPLNNPNAGNNLSRTETGPVLLEAFQGFLGQTSILEWGKAPYGPGENGGITGIVHYATTRAENDPAYAAAEVWEPGIPRVQVNLYADNNNDRIIDDRNGDGVVTLADVDNHPFGWSSGGPKGPEDVDRNNNGLFDLGDALQKVTTDSWDDAPPTGCQGPSFLAHGVATDCFDGLRVFNQVRPGVFDGGYAFTGVLSGTYIVESATPRTALGEAYKIVKEEDKNVDFGDTYKPSPLLLPPACVGDPHVVPAELSLFPGVPAAFAGQTRPLCDRKQITLRDGVNAAVDFNLFTETPVAGHIYGFVLDDTANEFDPNSPNFGEKFAPPWLPISIRDHTGREIDRTYADEWGHYNALVPSTFSANVANPSGFSPNMVMVCLNDPGPIPDPTAPGTFITDPYFNRQYSQFCYTFQYMPGTTTYLDTPVLPTAAFAGQNQFPLDCEYPNGIPKIYSVSGPMGGPYVASAGAQITVVSEGMVDVPNPLYDGANGVNPKTIKRDNGFGTKKGFVTIAGKPLTITAWTPDSITATVPTGVGSGILMVKRGDNGNWSKAGVLTTVGPVNGSVVQVPPGSSIQNAIDLAKAGDLILVPPGNYHEMVVLWKPVRLQGWGAGSTIINAVNIPTEKLQNWRNKVQNLINSGAISLLPGQRMPTTGMVFDAGEGAAITVLAKNATQANGGFGQFPAARIDGFTLKGSSHGGGIYVNGYARYLEISNNRIINNQGVQGGGIIVGNPDLNNGFNENLLIRWNHITQNSGLGGAGGGISLYPGTNRYSIISNNICGNFTTGEGGGIGHYGLSFNGYIGGNSILFNQSFNQGRSVSGGGILISGITPLNGLTPGAGSVLIANNLIQGNLSGAGDGGAIRLAMVNGQDVSRNNNTPGSWFTVSILNNMLVNNVAGLAGGGISLQDSVKVNLLHNTIANNDSAATAGAAFAPGSPNQSTSQPAGIVARAHSPALKSAFTGSTQAGYSEFSNPLLANNVLWHNRTFYFKVDTAQNPTAYLILPDARTYWDLQVTGTANPQQMNPLNSILTSAVGYDPSNVALDPMFISEYLNGARSQVLQPEVTTAIQTMPAFDEGGNFIDVRFGPLTLLGNYHLKLGSPAIDKGNGSLNTPFPTLNKDYDFQVRPNGAQPDAGADERY